MEPENYEPPEIDLIRARRAANLVPAPLVLFVVAALILLSIGTVKAGTST